MLHKLSSVFIFTVVFMVALTSCNKEEEPVPTQPLEVITVRDIPADPTIGRNPTTGAPIATGKFTFYSLQENKIVANTDSATNKWDIAFRGTTILINGGAVRSGKGGVYIYTGLFEDLKEIPENQAFNEDKSETELAIPTGSGKGWYNYNPATNLITPIPGRVLVIRTAEGKYAKVEITSYYKGAPAAPSAADASRYYTFRFIYQPNGIKKF